MESRIPVPTDNIFKFYALFGLLLFVFACGALLYVNSTSNAVVFASVPELEALKEFEEPSRSDRAQIAILERKIEITKANRDFYYHVIGVLGGIAMLFMFFGFVKWHTQIQPVLDEAAKVQLEIAKLQLEKLRRDVELVPNKASSEGDIEPVAAPVEIGDLRREPEKTTTPRMNLACDRATPVWDIAQERAFIETLMNQRFSFFLVFYGLILNAAFSIGDAHYFRIALWMGFFITFLLAASIYRAYVKANTLFKYIKDTDKTHPMAYIDGKHASWWSVRWLLGIAVPAIAVLSLGFLAIAASRGELLPK